MMKHALLRLLAITVFLLPSLAMADSIASMSNPDRDYTIEGDVVTVWEDSFLFNDGSGQIIIDIRPYSTHGLGIAGRDYVQVTGRVDSDGVMRPLVLAKQGMEPVLFQGEVMLPPLSFNEVMKNTVRYRLPRRVIPGREASGASATQQTNRTDVPNQPQRNAIAAADYANENRQPDPYASSSGASPVSAVQPVGSGPASGSAPPANSTASAVRAAGAAAAETR